MDLVPFLSAIQFATILGGSQNFRRIFSRFPSFPAVRSHCTHVQLYVLIDQMIYWRFFCNSYQSQCSPILYMVNRTTFETDLRQDECNPRPVKRDRFNGWWMLIDFNLTILFSCVVVHYNNCKVLLPITDKFLSNRLPAIQYFFFPFLLLLFFFLFLSTDETKFQQADNQFANHPTIRSYRSRVGRIFFFLFLKKFATSCLAYGRENNLRLRELTIVIH